MTTPITPRVEAHGLGDAPTTHARGRVLQLLTTYPVAATAAELRFTDQNGPKGGEDIRCALTVKFPRHGAIHVTDVGISVQRAFVGALEKLERRLIRARTGFRDQRRHPKKYFVAAEAWRSGGAYE